MIRNLLIVDDEQDLRDLLGEVANELSINVTYAEDGQIASDLVKDDHSFDLICTDLSMPKISGIDLIKIVREKGIMTPFLLLSGNPKGEVLDLLGNVPYVSVLEKPISIAELKKNFSPD